jgi:hypothetical protein
MKDRVGVRSAVLCSAFVVLAMSGITASAAYAGNSVSTGNYKGSVGPGYPITFSVSGSGSSVDTLVVGFDATCEGAPANTAPLFHFKTLAIKDAKFSGKSTDRFQSTASDGLRINGTFSGDRASGTVSSKLSIKSLGSCSQTEPFSATLVK